jgi:hypothetical protein
MDLGRGLRKSVSLDDYLSPRMWLTFLCDPGIHCASWQPCRLAQAGVLASGGASGFVRIDVLKELFYDSKKGQSEGEDEEDELDED